MPVHSHLIASQRDSTGLVIRLEHTRVAFRDLLQQQVAGEGLVVMTDEKVGEGWGQRWADEYGGCDYRHAGISHNVPYIPVLMVEA